MLGFFFNISLFLMFSFADIPGWIIWVLFYFDLIYIMYRHRMEKDNILK